jgi:hypothetical protein
MDGCLQRIPRLGTQRSDRNHASFTDPERRSSPLTSVSVSTPGMLAGCTALTF